MPDLDSRSLWQCLMLEGFQAGLAWIIVLRKREAFRTAFRGFVPEQVAALGEPEIVEMLANPGVIRSRAKIEATIGGARAFLSMQSAGIEFSDFAWDLVGGQPIQNSGAVLTTSPLAESISKQLKQRGFKFVGPTITYAWMQAVGMVNDHAEGCFRREDCASRKRGTA